MRSESSLLSAQTQATITSQLRCSCFMGWLVRGLRFAPPTVYHNLTASRLTKPHLPYFHILVHIAGERREARMHQKPGMSDREAEASVRTTKTLTSECRRYGCIYEHEILSIFTDLSVSIIAKVENKPYSLQIKSLPYLLAII